MRWLTMIVLLFGCTVQAIAQPEIGPRTLQVFPRGEERCYRGVFDQPKKGQIVQSFQLYRLFRPNAEKEAIERSTDAEIAYDKGPDAANWALVTARLKSRDGVFSQSLSCYDGEDSTHMRCGVDCDGGSFILDPAPDGVRITFEEGNGLALNSSCGDPDDSGLARWLTGEEAGTTMQLASLSAEACLAEDRAAKPSFVKDGVPLRERIGPGKWTCLSRSYDKAHLAKHPKQKVRAIALVIEDAPHAVTDEYEFQTTVFDAELSVALRDGSKGRVPVQCMADEFQFRCDEAFRLRRNDGKTAMLLAGAFGGEGAEPPSELAGVKIGADDLVFRLNGGASAECMAK